MKKLTFICTCLLLVTPCVAKTITVDDDGPADFNNIQAATDLANYSDTILIADGTYTGNGNKNLDFKGKTITVRSKSGPENCIIDCQNAGRGFYFHRGENSKSVLDGLTITNGRAAWGAGIMCRDSSPTITNCIISQNTSRYFGGGVYCAINSKPTINSCTISDNSAESQGGGIWCRDSNPKINNCTISRNTAGDKGGGISCEGYYHYGTYDRVRINNCSIIDNSACRGGGIYGSCYTSIINNCTISGNTANSEGGGIFFNYSSNWSIITNCTITKLPSINFEQSADAAVKDDFSADSVSRLLS